MNASLGRELRDLYAAESARIREKFRATSNGREALLARTALVESIARQLWKELISPDLEGPRNFALVALGGFGRRWLFPYSDIDLLFLHANGDTEKQLKDPIQQFSQEIWDLRLKLSPATRTLAECGKFDPNNLEFAISLLDCRYLAGDLDVFRRLHDDVIPKLVQQESRLMVQRLAELARARYSKFGGTVFHLEPNVKEGPGGLRDYNLVCWLELIAQMEEGRGWPDNGRGRPGSIQKQFDSALGFLMSARCFLHFRHARDDNALTWEAQDEAAALKIGASGRDLLSPSDWMRIYFAHARAMHRACTRLMEEFPAARPSLYRQFQNLRSRLSNAEFSVVDGLLFFQDPEALREPELVLRAFRFMARHGLKISSTAEHQIEEALSFMAANPPEGVEIWHYLQEILLASHAAEALREMHSLRLLTLLMPEIAGIDALVMRDYSHRFTVDEHTFVAIENLHLLRQSQSKWDQRYAELLDEVEQPDLLYLALLLARHGQGCQDPQSRAGQRRNRREVPRTARPRRSGSRNSPFPDRPPSGNERRAAARHLRSGNHPPVCRESGNAGAPEDALPVHVCGYQSGESRGADAVEGGKHLAALHRHRELPDCARWTNGSM